MLTEIEIEDVGIYRLPNMWQWKRIQRVRGPNRHMAPLAVGLGLTYREFRAFAMGKAEGGSARLLKPYVPANIDPLPRTGPAPRTVAFRPRVHRTDEEKAEIGKNTLCKSKKSLPRGHFWAMDQTRGGYSGCDSPIVHAVG